MRSLSLTPLLFPRARARARESPKAREPDFCPRFYTRPRSALSPARPLRSYLCSVLFWLSLRAAGEDGAIGFIQLIRTNIWRLGAIELLAFFVVHCVILGGGGGGFVWRAFCFQGGEIGELHLLLSVGFIFVLGIFFFVDNLLILVNIFILMGYETAYSSIDEF